MILFGKNVKVQSRLQADREEFGGQRKQHQQSEAEAQISWKLNPQKPLFVTHKNNTSNVGTYNFEAYPVDFAE